MANDNPQIKILKCFLVANHNDGVSRSQMSRWINENFAVVGNRLIVEEENGMVSGIWVVDEIYELEHTTEKETTVWTAASAL